MDTHLIYTIVNEKELNLQRSMRPLVQCTSVTIEMQHLLTSELHLSFQHIYSENNRHGDPLNQSDISTTMLGVKSSGPPLPSLLVLLQLPWPFKIPKTNLPLTHLADDQNGLICF